MRGAGHGGTGPADPGHGGPAARPAGRGAPARRRHLQHRRGTAAHRRPPLCAEDRAGRAGPALRVPAAALGGGVLPRRRRGRRPRAVHTDGGPAARHTLQTHCPGTPWDDSLTAAEQAALRRELGGHVARLHRVTGPGFGYPSGALGPLAPNWRTAFTTMTDAVLADARDYAADLPCPVDEVARTLRSGHDALDDVTVPRAVHFDLWPGNILVHRTPAGPRVGGLIDGERMFWGDPVADLVSLALLDDIEKDQDFLAGYRDAGGRISFDRSERLRLALYRACLYLIMLVETVPRAVDAERRRRTRETVAPELVAALDEIKRLRLSS
ncbi:phosphotransferase family protein [Streptomyces sp. NRRL WC-3744]|uniref:phosphotransferase family protein n=1 Tax=Streptomyces sp. NRRL WC-3744 TaxID=1463935 RepID=UPI0009976E82|nr:aminoglycoside phosphotransferase family protein [Streptomyces sp. NRRL WC-3744]